MEAAEHNESSSRGDRRWGVVGEGAGEVGKAPRGPGGRGEAKRQAW